MWVVGVVARGPGPEMRFATKFRCDCFLFASLPPSSLLRSLVRLVFGSVLLIFSFSLLLLCDCNRVLSVLVVVVLTVSLSFVFFGQQPAHFRTQLPPAASPYYLE